ncbi:inositol 2-dehydrogenase [Rhodoluna lacicola]|uniref:inositol 2-dehydrogenase n=1 Tax=Rhodoluna lacicola TaxID=529884 RepID=UPI00222EBDC0|nr:inositol 2-dehydrogenase [Rhodoluna lacicola]BDS51040.1 inositol 2-dehydrogenase [Rhodoluna lacicola]
MSDKKVRIGLLGAGRIGQVHAISIAANPNVELTYVADVFIDGAKKITDKFGGKAVADPAEVFASGEVDAVVVAAPTPLHVDLISAAIDAGVHVLCEKPIDLDIARVEELRAKANGAKTVVALGFNRRFDQQFNEIHARVTAGEIGTLEQLTIISRDPSPAPKDYLAVSGGIFRDQTIHDFDMARFFIPNIVEVYASGANVFSDDIKSLGDYDSAVVTLRGSKDELVTIINSRHASYGYDQRLEAFGSKGALLATNVSPTTVKLYNDVTVEGRNPYMQFFLERYAFSYARELELFVEGIQTGKVLNPTFDDGRAALILADAATESAKTGKAVKINLS